MKKYDAVIVGSGPNGYAAAIRLLQHGLSVIMLEANKEIGGGVRSQPLTLPGFVHDTGSAVHPLGMASPFFSTLPLEDFGLSWVQPTAPLAHPLGEQGGVVVYQDIDRTAEQLGQDADAYRRLMAPSVASWDEIAKAFLGPLRWPAHPFKLARFGLKAIQPISWLAKAFFKEEKSQALLAGLAAHAMLPLDKFASSGIAMVLGTLAHKVGWPVPKGGAATLSHALHTYFLSLGGEIRTGIQVKSLSDLPPCSAILFDTAPRLLLELGGLRLPTLYRQQLKAYRYGQGIFKMDWALSEPIPFSNPEMRKAGTIHIGGTFEEIARSEKEMWQGKHSKKPYVLLVQPSLFDDSRAPEGKHTAWAYCHVPAYSEVDMTEVMESQIERYAPGFRDIVLARHCMNTKAMQNYSANYIGGDINTGAQTITQLFTRPVYSFTPYRTAVDGMYLCSSATPPGGGVHGMCGFHAAETAIRDMFSKKKAPAR
ncbi:MAG: phytoene desaturase family protein [Cyclobacteriaceae bacterium]